jgi:hypothetical protein
MDCANNMIMEDMVILKRYEYDRLKRRNKLLQDAINALPSISEINKLRRLDENVNKLKEQIKLGEVFNIPIELLESLDK